MAQNGLGKTAVYGWRVGDRSCRLFVHVGPDIHAKEVWNNSLPSTIGDIPSSGRAGVLSYRVAHAPWRVAVAASSGFEGDATTYWRRLQRFFELIPRFLRRDLRLRYLQEKESDE